MKQLNIPLDKKKKRPTNWRFAGILSKYEFNFLVDQQEKLRETTPASHLIISPQQKHLPHAA